eukprot:172504-Hanusia_phi.AAC.1
MRLPSPGRRYSDRPRLPGPVTVQRPAGHAGTVCGGPGRPARSSAVPVACRRRECRECGQPGHLRARRRG